MRCKMPLISLLMFALAGAAAAEFAPGDKLQLLTNLHPDTNKRLLYTLNYQLPNLIPMCTEVEVVKQSKKKLAFLWNDVEYVMQYDKHTKKAGVSFDTVLADFFGPKCDAGKVKQLSQLDQKGIRKGIPYEGMTKQGILYAMGRPPRHATPDLDGYTWMYWLNRFKRKAIDFDDKGVVEEIRL